MSTLDAGTAGRRPPVSEAPSTKKPRKQGRSARRKKKAWRKARAPIERPSATMSVPEAGKKYFGLSRNASYEAAARGQIPTVRILKFLRVPVTAMERMLAEARKEPDAAA